MLAHAGWTPSLTHLFFLFTPQNVGSCAEGFCAYTDYCSYHGSFGSGSALTLYANQPYAAFVGDCDAGQRPNGD